MSNAPTLSECLDTLATLTVEQWPTCDWAEERSALASMYPTVGLAASAIKHHRCFRGDIDVPLTKADLRFLRSAALDD